MKAEITNEEFLNSIFNRPSSDSVCWTTHFDCAPKESNNGHWRGVATLPSKAPRSANSNNYFSTALFKAHCKPLKRARQCAKGLHCVVLDDIENVSLEPTWRLETSPGNYQAGYRLSLPLADMDVATRLLEEIGRKSLINGNDRSGNNPVRYVRLPVGSNTKVAPPFQHILHEWMPDRKFTIEELISAFGLDISYIFEGRSSSTLGKSPEGKNNYAELTREILESEHYYDPLLRLTGSLVSCGMPTKTVTEIAQGVMNAVSNKPSDWKRYYDQIPSMVASAEFKFLPNATEASDWLKELFPEYPLDLAKPKATNWVIDGFLRDQIVAIAGAPGTGKSSIIIPMAMGVAHFAPDGHELRSTIRRKVVYFTEDPSQVEEIIFATCKWGGISASPDEIREWFSVIECRRVDPVYIGKLIEWKTAEKSVQMRTPSGELIEAAPLIVVDTAPSMFKLKNESDNSEVSDAIGHIKAACSGPKTPLWLIAHTPKTQRDSASGGQVRGASAWAGDVQATATIFKDTASGERLMRLDKRRYEQDFDQIKFESRLQSLIVDHPLGHTETKTYRLGFCRKFDSRQQATQRGVDTERNLQVSILLAVQGLSKTAGEKKISRRMVSKEVTGKTETVNRVIRQLIATGDLVDTPKSGLALGDSSLAREVNSGSVAENFSI